MSTAGLELKTESPERTFDLGRFLGERLRAGDCVGLVGELGAGKTLFVKGLAQGMGCLDEVVSPTFNLMLEYRGRIPLRHLDAYFAKRERALLDEAADEAFGRDGVVVVEWADRVAEYLPGERLEIEFELLDPESRLLRLRSFGARGGALLETIRGGWGGGS